MAVITGNTFPVKDKLKALGGVWKPALKGWIVPDSVADKAQALVAGAGPEKPRGGYRPRTCKSCGQRINFGVYCGKCEYSY